MAPVIEVMQVPPLGCNCSIIGDSESKDAVVVDPGGDVEKIVAKLKLHGLSCKRILITHGHLDHIIGATELKKLTGAVILMNQNDLSLYEKVTEQCRDFRIPPPIEPLLPPDDFLADGDVVQWAPDLTMRCLHCPGHTPGSMSYYFEQQKIVCPGDTLFQDSVGRTNWAGIPSLQGTSDASQIIGSIKSKLLTLDGDVRVISGHGPETTVGLEKAHNMFLR
ncbi:unnamed protein product [Effrenium voratum]|nr:unnamed protein product [Effrenium voratum]|mmetsp:Transcript_129281/g.306771  ORF Transcript_129281/g.306771 Transcript_129281/m.306771 type:complete len:221 (+) Transcript_129281:106-768(+)